MKYLLDTHALLWIVTEDQKLSENAKRLFLDSKNEIYFRWHASGKWQLKSALESCQ